jgi:hypothetical protein
MHKRTTVPRAMHCIQEHNNFNQLVHGGSGMVVAPNMNKVNPQSKSESGSGLQTKTTNKAEAKPQRSHSEAYPQNSTAPIAIAIAN